MTDQNSVLLAAAMEYAGYGWKVLPLRDGSKVPRIKNWQTNASSDEEQICKWWERWPNSNVGVQLGERSGIIDCEADSPEEEQDFLKLFSGIPPVTCVYQSSRGKHWIFRWKPGLPGGAVATYGKLKIRVGNNELGAQSVFPPSLHPSGVNYQWLVSPGEVEPAELSDLVVARLFNMDGEDISPPGNGVCHSGAPEGCRNETAAKRLGGIFAGVDVFDAQIVESQWGLTLGWNHLNDPPLPADELRATFDSILKREKQKRATQTGQAALARSTRRDPESGNLVEPEWRLVIVNSQPPFYKLFSPLWKGFVGLTAAQMRSAREVSTEALQQGGKWLPTDFWKTWDGFKAIPSLANQLVESAEHEEDDDEARRDFVVASLLYSALTDTPIILQDEDEIIDERGCVCRMMDGSYIFKFEEIWKPMEASGNKVKRRELTAILRELGVVLLFPRIYGTTQRRMKLNSESMRVLGEKITAGWNPTRGDRMR
jgi:hypothetical protein